jgi:hypothetical protein
MDLAIAEKGFERVNLIPRSALAAAAKGRGILLEAVAKIDDPGLRRSAAFSAMQELARETNTQPFQFLEDAIGRENLGMMNISSFSRHTDAVESNPVAAANWAAALPAESRNEFLNWVLDTWKHSDSKAAMEWLRQNAAASSPSGEGTSVSAFAKVLLADRLVADGKTAEAMTALAQVTEDGTNFRDVSWKLAREDPEAAARWAAALPDGKARDYTANQVAETWVVRNPAAAAQWVEKLPPGTTRNEALAGMINGIVEIDPEGASRWAALIGDPKRRAASVERVYGEWFRRDPAAAREWVRTIPDVDERWRTKFLRRHP